MKLCNYRYPKNAKGRCCLRTNEVSGVEWKYDSAHVFANEGSLPDRRGFYGTYICAEAMTAVCPYRIHTPTPKKPPCVWHQCPYCKGRHRTEQAVMTCKAYGEFRIAMESCIESVSGIKYNPEGTTQEVYPEDVLKFYGFQNTRAHIWPWMQAKIVARDNLTCQDCGVKQGTLDSNGYSMRFEVHHIIPRGMGGSDHPANLKLVCQGCHKKYNEKFNGEIIRQRAQERKKKRLKVSDVLEFDRMLG